jgi:hypothetical protein
VNHEPAVGLAVFKDDGARAVPRKLFPERLGVTRDRRHELLEKSLTANAHEVSLSSGRLLPDPHDVTLSLFIREPLDQSGTITAVPNVHRVR